MVDLLPPHLAERVRATQRPVRTGGYVLYWMRAALPVPSRRWYQFVPNTS